MVEQPAVQVMGAGLNSTVTADLSGDFTTNCNDDGFAGLVDGEGANFQFSLVCKRQETSSSLFMSKRCHTAVGHSSHPVTLEVAAPTAAPATTAAALPTPDGSPVAG